MSPSLPAVSSDAERLLQVLSNLLGNAIKFTPPNGQVSMHAYVTGDEVVVTIADTGPGIPAEQLPRVFASYWQHRQPGTPRGTGLGLSIVKGIIDAHGGRVWAESTEGQ